MKHPDTRAAGASFCWPAQVSLCWCRRTVADLGQRIDKQRARLPQTRNKGEFEMEQTIKKMQHKENKLAGGL